MNFTCYSKEIDESLQTIEIKNKCKKEIEIERQIISNFSSNLADLLAKSWINIKLKNEYIEEIRLRAEKPLIISNTGTDYFITNTGGIEQMNKNCYIVTHKDIMETMQIMSKNSLYAYQEDMRNGFITLTGGHRVGIAGRFVVEEGKIKSVKEISSLNIRIAHQVIGCSKSLLKHIIYGDTIFNTLIISPPQCGKTTILRDIARYLSNGADKYLFKPLKVGIVDERSEIAAVYRGIPQNDVGLRTDILDGCPKVIGLGMMIRTMSPNVIITDEIGGEGDAKAVLEVMNAGVKIITTAHGYSISQMRARNEVLRLMENNVFERYIVLSSALGPGTLEEVIDGKSGKLLYSRKKGKSDKM